MGRRLIAIAGIALAAACGVRAAPAQPQPEPVFDLGPPSEMPAPAPPPEELPPPVFGADPGLPPPTVPGEPEPVELAPTAEPPGLVPAPGELPPPEDFGAPVDPPGLVSPPVAIPPPGGFVGVEPPGLAPPVDPGVETTAAPTPRADSIVTPYVLPPDQLRTGKQSVGVSVEVQAPPVVNLNQEATLKVVVRNNGVSPALGVDVYYQLPENLDYLDSQPAATDNTKVHLLWKLETLAVGAERVLSVRVRPREVGEISHAATVVMRTGAKAATHVQEPKLRVEQSVEYKSVLKGQQAQINITVSNPGTGPARNVLVQARLSAGLRHEVGQFVEQVLKGDLEPGQRVELEPLIVETVAGGEQSCTVTVSSPDVPASSEGPAKCTVAMIVVEPKLDLKLVGHSQRYTDMEAVYHITVHNPGTAAAQGVRVWAMMPLGGEPLPDLTDASHERQYDRSRRLYFWNIPQLNPDERVELDFAVRLGGLQLYKVTAQAQATRPLDLRKSAEFTTNVTGMADVEMDVDERRRILDAGEETTYEIRIRNEGTKDATGLLVSAELSEQIRVVSTSTGQEGEAKSRIRPEDQVQELVFPRIERLAPKGELVLRVNVKAVKAGVASCKVQLAHDDIGTNQLSRTAITHVTEPAAALR